MFEPKKDMQTIFPQISYGRTDFRINFISISKEEPWRVICDHFGSFFNTLLGAHVMSKYSMNNVKNNALLIFPQLIFMISVQKQKRLSFIRKPFSFYDSFIPRETN